MGFASEYLPYEATNQFALTTSIFDCWLLSVSLMLVITLIKPF